MRGLCVIQAPAVRLCRARLGVVAAVVAAAMTLSGCSTVQGWLTGRETVKAADAAPGAQDPYPSLGSVPDRPKPAESADERKEIAKSLIADRDRIAYMDQQLRGGTEISAPPPPAPVAGAAKVEPTATVASKDVTTATAKDDEPGFFGRLFGRKKKTVPAEPVTVEAHPSGAVDVAPAGAAPMPEGPAPR